MTRIARARIIFAKSSVKAISASANKTRSANRIEQTLGIVGTRSRVARRMLAEFSSHEVVHASAGESDAVWNTATVVFAGYGRAGVVYFAVFAAESILTLARSSQVCCVKIANSAIPANFTDARVNLAELSIKIFWTVTER